MYNGITTVLLILQFVIAMLFYPLRVGANGHASLANDKIEVDVRLLGLTVAKVRVKKTDGVFKVQINGKIPDNNDNVNLPGKVISAIKSYKIEGIKAKGNLLALIATKDAKNTAMLYAALCGALAPLATGLRIFTAKPSDTFEIDGRVKIKITILQMINMIIAILRG